MSTQGAT